jgi:hypothetical protein
MIDYEFDFAETLNDITSGLVKYRLELRQSGLLPYNSGIGTHPLVGSANSMVVVSGLGAYTLSGLIETNDYHNGLYVLTLFLEDLVGNKSEFQYFLYIENELFISEATVVQSGLGYDVTVTFNTFYEQSGLAALTTSDLRVLFTSGSFNVDLNSPSEFDDLEIIDFNDFPRSLTFRITRLVADFADMETIEIFIKPSGVVKFKEPRLNLVLNSDNTNGASLEIDNPTITP